MAWPNTQKLARTAFLPTAIAICLLVLILVADWAVDRVQTRQEDGRIELLEERVKREAWVEPALSVERDWKTYRTLKRKERIRLTSALLTLASALFLASATALSDRRPAPVPALQDLVDARFAAPAPQLGGTSGTKRKEPDTQDVDAIVARLGRDEDAAIAILQEIQELYGYLPDQAMERVTQITDITPAQIAGTSTFYNRFRRSPRGDHLLRICVGTACHVSGAQHIDEEIRRQLEIPKDKDTDPDLRFTLTPVACLGCCSLAPVIMVDERTAGRLTPGKVANTLRQVEGDA